MAFKVRWGTYDFDVYEKSVNFQRVGGVYIFSGFDPFKGRWISYYIGQTNSFANRIPGHPKWHQASLNGATHVHLLAMPQSARRELVERSLIQRLSLYGRAQDCKHGLE